MITFHPSAKGSFHSLSFVFLCTRSVSTWNGCKYYQYPSLQYPSLRISGDFSKFQRLTALFFKDQITLRRDHRGTKYSDSVKQKLLHWTDHGNPNKRLRLPFCHVYFVDRSLISLFPPETKKIPNTTLASKKYSKKIPLICFQRIKEIGTDNFVSQFKQNSKKTKRRYDHVLSIPLHSEAWNAPSTSHNSIKKKYR